MRFLLVRHGFQLFLDAEQPGGHIGKRDADHVGYVLIAHILQPKKNDGSIEDIESVDSVVQHLNLFAMSIVIVVQVDVDGKRNGLYTTLLLPFMVVASIQADAPNPGFHTTFPAEFRESFPEVDQYLLVKVVHLFRVFGEEIADGINRLPVFLHHFCKLQFNVIHPIFFVVSIHLDTRMGDSFQNLEEKK